MTKFQPSSVVVTVPSSTRPDERIRREFEGRIINRNTESLLLSELRRLEWLDEHEQSYELRRERAKVYIGKMLDHVKQVMGN